MKKLILTTILLTSISAANAFYDDLTSDYGYDSGYDSNPIRVDSYNFNSRGAESGYLYRDSSGGYYGNTYDYGTGESNNVRILHYGNGNYRIQETKW